MTEQHRITPPPELLQTLWDQFNSEGGPEAWDKAIAAAAQWGADQELEACCEWVEEECPGYEKFNEKLRTARRPKPPSLKQQALDLLKTDLEPGQEVASITLPAKSIDTIRRALELFSDE